MKKSMQCFKRALRGLHIDTNDHVHWKILGGRYCETRRFITSCLFYSLPYSLLCKCFEFLPCTDGSYSIVKQSAFIQEVFNCILYFANISSTNRIWQNPDSVFKRAHGVLDIATNDHFHTQIFAWRHCKTRWFIANLSSFAHIWKL